VADRSIAAACKKRFSNGCDCPTKIAAIEKARAERFYMDHETREPFGERVVVGQCPGCIRLLVGHCEQTAFENIDSEFDVWSDVSRVYPKPAKAISNFRLPASAQNSLLQADKCLQAGATDAACVMFGRALEAICSDLLLTKEEKTAIKDGASKKHILLADGIKQLRAKNIIDDRLLDWSQELRAFRNVAAHAVNEEAISRQDAEDLQAFVYAIVEYIYDLSQRYKEFKERKAAAESKKNKKGQP
jgi:Domain of unknown function (DUF4145)